MEEKNLNNDSTSGQASGTQIGGATGGTIGTVSGGISTVLKLDENVSTKKGFLYEISNSNSTVSDMKTVVNSIMKTLEKDEEVIVAFKLHILGNVDLTKEKSTITEIKSLVSTMLKHLAASGQISYDLRIESI